MSLSPSSEKIESSAGAASSSGFNLRRWFLARGWRVEAALMLALYLVFFGVYAACAAPQTLSEHTDFNHFAHLAQSWLNGRLDLAEGAPAYAQNNDFARFEGRWFVTFPPFPAVILLPFVAIAGAPELIRDGLVFIGLAALGPTLLYWALQRLACLGHSARSRAQNVALSLCFGFGTVFFFTAEQGTVWFAAHVVGVALAALYLTFAVDARRPLLAGVALGLGLMTRAPLVFAAPLFVLEAWRVSCSSSKLTPALTDSKLRGRLQQHWRRLNKAGLGKKLSLFALPLAVCVALTLWHNYARFEDPWDTGYKYLTVAWQKRMQKWGLFHYHYLPKNLGVILTSLPWLEDKAPFRINVHGLALWFTTPLYFWLLWPRQRGSLHRSLWVTVACVALPTLLYQNSGWAQFGYRFSNDYAVFLFALLAIGMRPMRAWFAVAAAWALAVNLFGALTFQRQPFRDYYYWQGSQERLYQKD